MRFRWRGLDRRASLLPYTLLHTYQVALLSMCLLAQLHEHASELVLQFAEIEISVAFLLQVVAVVVVVVVLVAVVVVVVVVVVPRSRSPWPSACR